ncbi:MAG: glycosyltransferase family 32 protein [Lachnospirales bacterium]
MVKLNSNGIDGLIENLKDKELICFGAGNHFQTVMNLYKMYDLVSYCKCIIDNNKNLDGKLRKYGNVAFNIHSLEFIKNVINKDKHVILITCHFKSMEVLHSLDEILEFENVEVYIGSFLSDELNYIGNYDVISKGEQLIPKTIHYCWFGKGEMPEDYHNYIDTWKEKCPSYAIKKWDESNFDITQSKYAEQAYIAKKWAFVSDYVRLKVLYDEGGIYLDCDVELLKNFDKLLENSFFCGFEDENHISFGLGFGSVKGHKLLEYLLDIYDKMSFINDDGTLNMTPCTAYQTEAIIKFGFEAKNYAQFKEGIAVYPTEVLAPISTWGVNNINKSAYSIHHFSASWQDNDVLIEIKKMYKEYQHRIRENR